MNKGYYLIWPANQNQYFITPQGSRVELEVYDDIPFLRRCAAISQPIPVMTLAIWVLHVANAAPHVVQGTLRLPTTWGGGLM
eukprot:90472-Heterocapsa_arctica.AAC.1